MTDVFITGAKRLPHGSLLGQWASLQGFELGAHAIKAVLPVNHKIEMVHMGCVLQAGQGQAPARQAALHAGLSYDVPSVTFNKVCGSGMISIMAAANGIRLQNFHTAIAGGMESMTNAPYLLEKVRSGYRMGHNQLIDHMMRDGLEDAYPPEKNSSRIPMGIFAEATAREYGFSRHDQEQFVMQTYENATRTNFHDEIAPIILNNKESITIENDESLKKVKLEKFSALKPAFQTDGTITAATSSSIADGASALCLMSSQAIERVGTKPMAKITGYTQFSREPKWFTLAPIGAVQLLLDKLSLSIADIDLVEINEAFAVVPLAVARDLKIPREKINVRGGACVLGHPIGSSGARILVTLIHALIERGLKRGIATACIGGGEATAIAVEIIK